MNPDTEQDRNPAISIVIANLHSPVVDRTINSIIEQDIEDYVQVIVVGMDKHDLVRQFPQVLFVETPAPIGAAEARNRGIRVARSNRIVFLDSDCVALPGWLAAIQADFDAGWQVIGGSVQTPGDNFWQDVYNLAMFHEQLPSQPRKEHRYLATLNLAVMREVVDRVGLLDETLLRGQDIEWTSRMTRAGYPLLFDPAARIEHHPQRFDFEAVRKDNYRSGYYMIEVRHNHPDIFRMPKLMKQPLFLRVFKPLIALWTTLKIIFRTREVRQQPSIFPWVYRIKKAWLDGAADRLDEMNHGR